MTSLSDAPQARITGWRARLSQLCEVVGVLLLGLLFMVFVVQVFARLVWGTPLTWTDEAAVILYTWLVLWGTAAICKPREHVAFDLLFQHRPAAMQRWVLGLSCAGVGGLMLWALPGAVDFIAFMRRENTPVLGWPLHWVYAPFALMLLVVGLAYVWRALRLMSQHWRDVVAEFEARS
jgi:hypothetical protein